MAESSGPLENVRIAVVGAGGLGCAVLPRLAHLPLARLTIIDGDRVELGNLPRQSLYEEMDLGHFKASTAAMWIRQVLISGDTVPYDVFLDPRNAAELLADHDIVVEGVDDLHAKALIDRTCAALGLPLVSGAVHERQGQVIVLHAPGKDVTLTRDDLFQGRAGSEQDGCDMRRVTPALLEEVGRQMMARVHDLLKGRALTNGRIDLFDGRQWSAWSPPEA